MKLGAPRNRAKRALQVTWAARVTGENYESSFEARWQWLGFSVGQYISCSPLIYCMVPSWT